MKGSNTRRILIVEDDSNTRALYEDAFKAEGFEVCILPDADDGFLERVAEFDPDVISIDLMIAKEGMDDARDGFEAIEALKRDLRTHEVPIFVVSNFIEEGRVRRAASLGATDYIVASGYSPSEIVKRFIIFLSDPEHYKPIHQFFQKKIDI